MTDQNKCSKCEGEMEKGMLTADSRHWMKDANFIGKLTKITNPGFGLPTVFTWRCNKCKKIEFTSS